MDLSAFSNGDPQGRDIAPDFAGGPYFHALAAPQCARHFSADDDLAGIDIRRNLAVRSYGDAAISEMNCTLNLAVDIQVIGAADFALNQ
jgi:hypothetical protein